MSGVALPLAGDIIAVGATLAGLVLVYLGTVAAGFGGYDKAQQASIRSTYQIRAWFAFAGILLAITASGAATIAKWLSSECFAIVAMIFLAFALLWSVLAAFLIAQQVK